MGLFGVFIDRVGRIPEECTTGFDFRGHLGAHVLHCLKRRNDAIKLSAFHRISDRLVQHFLGCSQRVCGDHDSANVDDGAQC